MILRKHGRVPWISVFLATASIHAFTACSSDDDGDSTDSTTGGAGGSPTADAGMDASGGSGGSTEPEKRVLPEWLTCTAPEDCVIVQEKVCSACATTSVNVAHEADVRDVYETTMGCVPGPPAPCGPISAAAPTCKDGLCDLIVDCETMEKSGLCGEFAKCSVLMGTPCHKGDAAAVETVRVGCELRQENVEPERTCGEDPATGQQLVFFSSQIPEAWTVCDLSACDA